MIKKDLVMRNVVEVVEEAELDELVKKGKGSVYCGYETSGAVHIGTMVTVQKLIEFQQAGLEVIVLFADIHTLLNRKGEEEWIKKMVEYWRHSFIGLGLDPKRTRFVLGSSFQMKPEYIHDVLTLGTHTTVNRATRSMQQVARDLENAHVSQLIYPLMQAADIKHLGVDICYGGIEQRKIHMLAREELGKIGYKKPICIHTPLIVSLGGPETKMSSSKPETIIAVHEDPKSIEEKVKKAYCPAGSAENNPILDVFRFFIFAKEKKVVIKRPEKYGGNLEFDSYEKLEKAFKEGLHPMDLKAACAQYLSEYLKPVRDHFAKNPEALAVLKG
jgi:tyrosyl-tRNA synthetase